MPWAGTCAAAAAPILKLWPEYRLDSSPLDAESPSFLWQTLSESTERSLCEQVALMHLVGGLRGNLTRSPPGRVRLRWHQVEFSPQRIIFCPLNWSWTMECFYAESVEMSARSKEGEAELQSGSSSPSRRKPTKAAKLLPTVDELQTNGCSLKARALE
jgi:hypothetical protein